MFARTSSVVGLDVGTSAIKAVELTATGKSLEVTGFGQIEVPPDDPQARVHAITELMREGGFRSRRVVSNISGKTVIVRYLTMPKMSDDELRSAIALEAGKYVPYPLDECVLDCQRLDGPMDTAGAGKMTVVFVAARRSQITEQLALLHDGGITPEVIDVDALALGNAWELAMSGADAAAQPACLAFVDVGATKTCLNIMVGDTSFFSREIYFGGRHFTEAIGRRLSIDPGPAEDMKRLPDAGGEAVRDALLPTIDDLGNEIQLSFDYFENQFQKKIAEIRLSGGGSRLAIIRESFEKIFERPTTAFNPFETLAVNPDVDADLLGCNASRLVVAVGLAARVRRA